MTSLRTLVTGGGRGIGRAIAARLAREGARIALCARSEHELEETAVEVARLGGSALAVPCDVTDIDSVRLAVARALEFTAGALDLLVNNAGVFDVVPLQELDPETWERMLRVNLTGPYLVTRTALPGLLAAPSSHIINIASTAARQGYAGSTAYCASKYGLRGFGDALREELRDAGIRVTTIYPGATDTAIFDGVRGDWDRSTMNRPEDVAEVLWRAVEAGPEEDVDDDVGVPEPNARG